MAEPLTTAEIGRRTMAMRAMCEDDRQIAIQAAGNVIGHGRFCDAARQVELRGSYRRGDNK